MKLSEDMVMARCRGGELENVKKLNCWGNDLSDVSVVRQMPNLEILALSVNNITTLADFQFCKNLSELYIRQNKVADLNEVVYLTQLPRLRSLWLADNPCTEAQHYRAAVLRALPRLHKLDNRDVERDEVQHAAIHAPALIHPEHAAAHQQQLGESDDFCNEDEVVSRAHHARCDDDSYHDNSHTPRYHDNNSHGAVRRHQQQQQQQQQQQHDGHRDERRVSSSSIAEYHRADSVESSPYSERYCGDGATTPRHHRSVTTVTPPDSTPPNDTASQRHYQSASCPSHVSQRVSVQSPAGYGRRVDSLRDESTTSVYSTPSGTQAERSFMMAGDDDGYRSALETSHYRHMAAAAAAAVDTCSEHGTRPGSIVGRPRKRSSNILSAVLCLIKELDTHGLEVVETAARCRIQELDD